MNWCSFFISSRRRANERVKWKITTLIAIKWIKISPNKISCEIKKSRFFKFLYFRTCNKFHTHTNKSWTLLLSCYSFRIYDFGNYIDFKIIKVIISVISSFFRVLSSASSFMCSFNFNVDEGTFQMFSMRDGKWNHSRKNDEILSSIAE